MVMAFTVNSRAALIFVVTIPLLSVVVFGIMVATRPLYKTVQNRLDRVLGLTREKASELLETIAPERIEKIENERTVPRPDEVLTMAEKYKAPVAVQLLLLAAVPYRPAVRTVCHAARAAGHPSLRCWPR